MPKQATTKKLGFRHYLVYELFPLVVLVAFGAATIAARAQGLIPDFVQ